MLDSIHFSSSDIAKIISRLDPNKAQRMLWRTNNFWCIKSRTHLIINLTPSGCTL